jgi:hypothetical protein
MRDCVIAAECVTNDNANGWAKGWTVKNYAAETANVLSRPCLPRRICAAKERPDAMRTARYPDGKNAVDRLRCVSPQSQGNLRPTGAKRSAGRLGVNWRRRH